MTPGPAGTSRDGATVEDPRHRLPRAPAVLPGSGAMHVISSPYTSLIKWGYAVVWLGFWLILGAVLVAKLMHRDDRPEIIEAISFATVMLLLGYLFFSMFLWNLADEVVDGGTLLEVRRGSVREVIELSQIMRVAGSNFGVGHLYQVFLRLRTPCAFGRLVRFVPRRNASWYGHGEVASDLAMRIEMLHQKRLAEYRDQVLQAAAASGNDGSGV
ncbi:MAG TPA: hypothetical protein VGH80_11500 [Xanthomonadaceae bacterium]|jgi:hypothetical protein